ncbi:unnamed protein product, partial [marine sediment metagenome]
VAFAQPLIDANLPLSYQNDIIIAILQISITIVLLLF